MKKLLFFVILICNFAALAGEWLTDATTQCKIWNPDETPDLTIRWTGECKNGKADGIGVLEWLKDGKLQSAAQRIYVDGWLQIKAGVVSLGQMAIVMKATSLMVGTLAKAFSHGRMVIVMKVILLMAGELVREFLLGRLAKAMKVISLTVDGLGKVS